MYVCVIAATTDAVMVLYCVTSGLQVVRFEGVCEKFVLDWVYMVGTHAWYAEVRHQGVCACDVWLVCVEHDHQMTHIQHMATMVMHHISYKHAVLETFDLRSTLFV